MILKIKSFQVSRDSLSNVDISCSELLRKVRVAEEKTVPLVKMIVFTGLIRPVFAQQKKRVNLMMVGLAFILVSVVMLLMKTVLEQNCYGKKGELKEGGKSEVVDQDRETDRFLLEILVKLSLICFFIGLPFCIGAVN